MMINLASHTSDFKRARARAQRLKTHAEQLASEGHLLRVASATQADRWYLDELYLNAENEVIASCECVAGRALYCCHHIAAAAETIKETREALDELEREADWAETIKEIERALETENEKTPHDATEKSRDAFSENTITK